MSEGNILPRSGRHQTTANINAERIDATTGAVRLPCGLIAFVDLEDVQLVSQYVWHACKSHRTHYARGGSCQRGRLLMHNLIMGSREDRRVDHKDGNGLNNRRDNLRWATRAQNATNMNRRPNRKSGFRGVHQGARSKKWEVSISADGVRHRLGSFATAEEAARVYDEAAKRLHGEFAKLNFPEAM